MEKSDFNKPQRQSIIGIIVLFGDTFQSIARAFVPLIAVWIFKFDKLNKMHFALGIGTVIAVIAIAAYLQYLNFTFYIDDENDEFIINKGVLNKTKIAIQLHKIQQVNINQSFIQRIIGVHALDVDTAGSSNKEVHIRAISHELALSLKAKLLENEGTKQVVHENDVVQGNGEKTVLKISFLSLVKVGLTSKYGRTFAVLLAFFATIYENLQQWSRANYAVEDKIDSYLNETTALLSVSIFLLGLFALILIINLGRTIIKYFDFKITKQQKSLVLSYGLLNTRNTIIKPEKVQIITLSRNYFQKKLNVLDIRIKQATIGESDKQERKSAIEIPGCNPTERDEILKLLLNKIPGKEVVLLPNIRTIIFSVLKFVVIPMLMLIFLNNFVTPLNYHYFYFIPVYLGVFGISMYFGLKNSRLFISNDTIIKQSGVWDIDQEIIEIQKIQAISTSQLFWHKGPNVGTITLHTAGGNISFRLANFTHIKQWVNTWLYQVETSEKSWNS